MTEELPVDEIGYDAMVQDALRGVVRRVLELAGRDGRLPGDHHVYLTFRTRAPGVKIPVLLREKYQTEMTVVIQHRFDNLVCDDTGFSVALSFGLIWHEVRVPWAAVTRFYDPHVQMLLQFDHRQPEEPAPVEAPDVDPGVAEARDGVVDLAAFRRPR